MGSVGIGALLGMVVALLALFGFAAWLQSEEQASSAANAAVWLMAWPLLLVGALGGVAVGAAVDRKA